MPGIEDLAEALNGREVTDENGEIAEETATEVATPEEQTPVEETATPEKAIEPEETHSDDSQELAEDDSGKRYVPEDRFKKVYGKAKALEREIAQLKKQQAPAKAASQIDPELAAIAAPKVDKADLIELKMTLPQFDPRPDEDGNPTNPDYSPELDQLGFEILKANPGITPLRAAQKALKIAKNIAKQEIGIRQEARAEKSFQSDQGITTRVVSRSASKPDIDNMSDKELEAYLRSTGQW